MELPVTPEGRMRRANYALSLLVLNLAMVGAGAILPDQNPESATVRLVMTLALSWLLYCVMARRLHDAGRSQTLAAILLGLVAVGNLLMGHPLDPSSAQSIQAGRALVVVATAIGLYVLVAPPKRGANRYGQDPRPLRIGHGEITS
jgi:uncharacterized membrane protein YhaH (DUF805 family)